MTNISKMELILNSELWCCGVHWALLPIYLLISQLKERKCASIIIIIINAFIKNVRMEFNTINSIEKFNVSTINSHQAPPNAFLKRKIHSPWKREIRNERMQNNNVKIYFITEAETATGKHMVSMNWNNMCNWFGWKVCRLDIRHSFRTTNNQIMNKYTNCTNEHGLPARSRKF